MKMIVAISAVAGMAMIGVPYGENVKEGKAEANARAQAKEIADGIASEGGPKGLESKKVVAMIAYLQRLGKDIKAPAEAKPTAQAETAPAAVAAGGGR